MARGQATARAPTPKAIFKKAEGAHIADKDVSVIGRRLLKLAKLGKGISPEQVLDDAKDPRSPFHKYFEWDNERAAHQYRLSQARHIIRSVHILFENPDGTTTEHKAFHNVVTTIGERKYVPLEVVIHNQNYLEQVIADARRDLEMMASRLERYNEMAKSVKHLREAIKHLPSS